MQRSGSYFKQGFAATLLAILFAANAHANPTLEHLDGLPKWVDNDVAVSGDAQWFIWADQDNGSPWLTTWGIDTSAEDRVDLALTTGIVGLSFANAVHPDANYDGSVIAVTADSTPTGDWWDDLALIVDPFGNEIARISGTDENNDNAWFDMDIFIDASGRFVTFTSNGYKLIPVIGGVTKPRSDIYEGYEAAFWMDIDSGAIQMVALKPNGSEIQDYTYALGISDGGRYVLFKSRALNLPGANGEWQLYLRDMDSTEGVDIILVSVDESGLAISSGLACCSIEPDISDDGTRVVFTAHPRQTYVWTRDTKSPVLAGSSRELTAVTNNAHISISGDGRWLTGTGEPFSRLNIDTGSAYPLTDIGNGGTAGMDDPRISRNGEVILFWNNDINLIKPDGEEGRWWIYRFDPIPGPIEIAVTETVPVNDSSAHLRGIILPFGETISVFDEVLVIPPLSIAVTESVGVSDDIVIKVGPTLADTIDLTLPPGPLLPGMIFTAKAGGFKPFTAVEAFLQSVPIKVGEEMADADGNVSFQITIPADFPPGDHTLILLGQAPDGSERRLTAAITIDPPDTIFKDSFE